MIENDTAKLDSTWHGACLSAEAQIHVRLASSGDAEFQRALRAIRSTASSPYLRNSTRIPSTRCCWQQKDRSLYLKIAELLGIGAQQRAHSWLICSSALGVTSPLLPNVAMWRTQSKRIHSGTAGGDVMCRQSNRNRRCARTKNTYSATHRRRTRAILTELHATKMVGFMQLDEKETS